MFWESEYEKKTITHKIDKKNRLSGHISILNQFSLCLKPNILDFNSEKHDS